ncbi:hypothetical protein [Qingshengfaniella alkalisoli]|uniref:ABC-type amino acid transport substrate-binding protein n=1 Tax=Qingshengfaniella alkalisoli TaxID=2599296 RepID=A0A5B8IUQ0_9RHOB|nr:hypothetical protein [Qingshengfaniella alkalisoli]QDY69153.1 hypothetical protein FPZ52_05565 [Qingshengfaniella alkalisoli]
MDSYSQVWPDGYMTSLWNYGALRQPRNIPFMGYELTGDFFFAFVVGAGIIIFFAFRRFNERSFDPASFDYRVLRELAPMELRGGDLMRRAYARYAGALLVIYVALTLFGRLILQTLNSLPAAGLQVDVSSLDFNSPQWPLLISFGMVGFLPMLKPVEVVEGRLRSWAHKSAGIPIKIADRTNKLKKGLDELSGQAPGIENAPAWLEKLAHGPEQQRAFRTRFQLQQLLDWSKDERTYWPNATVRSTLRRLEQEEAGEAFIALQDFEDLLAQDYSKPPKSDEDANSGMADEDRLVLHRKRLERNWNDITARMEKLRDELASILVVYAERDRAYSQIESRELRRLIRDAFADDFMDEGPEYWILTAMIPVAAVYALGVTTGIHALLGNVDKTTLTVTLTTILETARTAIQFCFPLFVAMGVRHYMLENDEWKRIDLRHFDRDMMQQLVRVGAIGVLSAAILLALLAMFWAALISSTEQRFREIYLSGPYPFLTYFVSQALISVIQVVMVVIAVDAKMVRKHRSRMRLIGFGIANALFIVFAWAAHLGIWIGFGFCNGASGIFQFLGNLAMSGPGSACFSIYGGIDFFVYAFLALGSAWFLIPPYAPKEEPPDERAQLPQTRPEPIPFRPRAQKTAMLALLAFGLLAATPGLAQETGDREVVRVGFRADAEPFAYLQGSSGQQRFRGYMVDLCYRLFSSDRYVVDAVEVTAENRFNAFETPPRAPFIDLLCDPVTLRFSAEDGRNLGVFSPIVFVSGVSYLRRQPQGPGGDVMLGYVRGSTAIETAQRACESDLFKVKPTAGTEDGCNDETPSNCYQDVTYSIDQTEEGYSRNRYFFCEFSSHTETIKWFCSGEYRSYSYPYGIAHPYGIERAYFGDRDIIIGKLEAWLAEDNSCSGVERKFDSYTYEPYALVIKKDKPDLIRFVQRRVYEVFSNRSEAVALFTTHFQGKKMSQALASLFLLNAVEQEDRFQRSDPEE